MILEKIGDSVTSDISIAQRATLKPITEIAARLGIPAASIENYGHYKAKIGLDYIDTLQGRADGKLILVTALSPTPAGEGKTTTTVGLGDALNKIGKIHGIGRIDIVETRYIGLKSRGCCP